MVGVTPPTPRWSAQGNSGRRSCRWQGWTHRNRAKRETQPPRDSGGATFKKQRFGNLKRDLWLGPLGSIPMLRRSDMTAIRCKATVPAGAETFPEAQNFIRAAR